VNLGWYGLTPLHIACCKGNVNIVNSLLENGADIHAGLPLDDYIVLCRLKSDSARTATKDFITTKKQWKSLEERKEVRVRLASSGTESKRKKKRIFDTVPEEYAQNKKINPAELAAACGHAELAKFLIAR
jgi:ankyrin repeat protein